MASLLEAKTNYGPQATSEHPPLPDEAVVVYGVYPRREPDEMLAAFHDHAAKADGFGPTNESGPGVLAMSMFMAPAGLFLESPTQGPVEIGFVSATAFGSKQEMKAFLNSPAGNALVEDGGNIGLLDIRLGRDFVLPAGSAPLYNRTIGNPGMQYEFPAPASQ